MSILLEDCLAGLKGFSTLAGTGIATLFLTIVVISSTVFLEAARSLYRQQTGVLRRSFEFYAEAGNGGR